MLDRLVAQRHKPSDQRYVVHDLKSLICTAMVLIAQEWRPSQDVDRLRADLAIWIAASARRAVATASAT